MGKLSKAENKLQKEIFELINSDKKLTDDERWHIYENFNPGYISNVGALGQFFTPINLAQDVAVMSARYGHIVDVCSGIGMLSYRLLDMDYYHCKIESITLIELNPEFCRIAKRLLSGMKNENGIEYKINFIAGNAFDQSLWQKLIKPLPGNKFDLLISNPPFGKIPKGTDVDWMNYKSEFDLMAVELALKFAKNSYFILPPMSVPFQYSGRPYYEVRDSRKWNAFLKANGNPVIYANSDGIDCCMYLNDWKGTKINVEAVRIDFEE